MTYAHERDQFIAKVTQAGLSLDQARLMLRYATTLRRLAEAQCNGDYPADNGERKVEACGRCGAGFVRASMKRCREQADTSGVVVISEQGKRPYYLLCPDCIAQDRVFNALRETPLKAVFNGDPRGAVLVLYERTTAEADIESGRERGIYVPTR